MNRISQKKKKRKRSEIPEIAARGKSSIVRGVRISRLLGIVRDSPNCTRKKIKNANVGMFLNSILKYYLWKKAENFCNIEIFRLLLYGILL